MILYFTGTGNSRYVANVIKSVTNDEIVSMNELIKFENSSILKSDNPFIFVFPTYALSMPILVREFIEKTKFNGCKKAYFIFTCEGEVGDVAEYQVQQICIKKGFEYMGFDSVRMPANHITQFYVPDKGTAKKIIENSKPNIYKIAEKIKNTQCLNKNKLSPAVAMKNTMIESMSKAYYDKMDNPKGFHVTDKCISCGKCVKLCPLNNIELINGKPKWESNCTHCMACICGCPKASIEFKNKTQGKPRYYLHN